VLPAAETVVVAAETVVAAAAETVVVAAETVAAAAVDQSQSILLQGSSAVAGFDRTADKRQAPKEREKNSSNPLGKEPLTPYHSLAWRENALYYAPRCLSC
jgi:hypothetical protein